MLQLILAFLLSVFLTHHRISWFWLSLQIVLGKMKCKGWRCPSASLDLGGIGVQGSGRRLLASTFGSGFDLRSRRLVAYKFLFSQRFRHYQPTRVFFRSFAVVYLLFKAPTYLLDVVIPFTIASLVRKGPLYRWKGLKSFLQDVGIFYLQNGKRKIFEDLEKAKFLHVNQ